MSKRKAKLKEGKGRKEGWKQGRKEEIKVQEGRKDDGRESIRYEEIK